MLTQGTNENNRSLLLQPYRESLKRALEKAERKFLEKERAYFTAKAEREEAEKERNVILEDQKALLRIESTYPLDDHDAYDEIRDLAVDSNSDELDGEDNEDDEERDNNNDGNSSVSRRKRLNIKPKMLEMIKASGTFKTLTQIMEMVSKEFGEDAVSLKTVQNRLGELTGKDEELKKFYVRENDAYSYGIPEWFEGNKPKSGLLEIKESGKREEEDSLIFVEEDEFQEGDEQRNDFFL